jgi:predicted RNA binding protein YcfA (HicA-like mRNA interferase family)
VELPTDLSGQELVKVLLRVGFVVNRQRGSHIILRRGNPYARVVVPDHKQVRPGTLRQILNEAGVTVEQLLELR